MEKCEKPDLGDLTHYCAGNGELMNYLQKQNYTNIYRKYRLKGYVVK